MSIQEIEARHHKESDDFKGMVGYPSCAGCTASWPCDTTTLLAELKERDKKLKASLSLLRWIEWHEELLNDVYLWWVCPSCGAERPKHEQGCWLARILKGGD